MIIVLKPQSTKQMVDNFVDSLQKNYDVKVNEWVGTQSTVLGLIGDTSAIDIDYISAQDIVESIKRVQAVSYTHLCPRRSGGDTEACSPYLYR